MAWMTVMMLASVMLEAVLKVLTDRLELLSDCGVEAEAAAITGILTPGIVARPFVPIDGSSLLAPRGEDEEAARGPCR